MYYIENVTSKDFPILIDATLNSKENLFLVMNFAESFYAVGEDISTECLKNKNIPIVKEPDIVKHDPIMFAEGNICFLSMFKKENLHPLFSLKALLNTTQKTIVSFLDDFEVENTNIFTSNKQVFASLVRKDSDRNVFGGFISVNPIIKSKDTNECLRKEQGSLNEDTDAILQSLFNNLNQLPFIDLEFSPHYLNGEFKGFAKNL